MDCEVCESHAMADTVSWQSALVQISTFLLVSSSAIMEYPHGICGPKLIKLHIIFTPH